MLSTAPGRDGPPRRATPTAAATTGSGSPSSGPNSSRVVALRQHLHAQPAHPGVLVTRCLERESDRRRIQLEHDRCSLDRPALEHGRATGTEGVDECAGVRTADPPRRPDRQDGDRQPDDRELRRRERLLSDERQHARDRGPRLARSTRDERADLITTGFRDDVDQRLPGRRRHALQPDHHDPAGDDEGRECRAREQDPERAPVEDREREDHRRRPQPGQQAVREEDRDHERDDRDGGAEHAEEPGEGFRIRVASGGRLREREEQRIEQDREQHTRCGHPHQER